MKTDSLVSIVLPTYNGSRYLGSAIRSCLDQTYSSIELIVVDDASTDETPAIARRFADTDSRVRVIRHARNRKLPAALNTGFAAANGEFLAWTSDDNEYAPNAVERMAGFLQDRPDTDLVYCDFTLIDEAGRSVDRRRVGDPEELIRGNCVGACFLYRRTVQEKVGRYSADLFLAEDYDYWLRASAKVKMVPLHEDLYRYRLHGDALTAQFCDGRIRKARDRALGRNLSRLGWLDAETKGDLYLELARNARWRDENVLAMKFLIQSGLYAPRKTWSLMMQVFRRRCGGAKS